MPDEMVVPDVIGEIVGWRAWRVIGQNVKLPMLASVTHGKTIWHPDRWTLATCGGKTYCHRCEDGRVPGEGCSCGMYAAKSREQLVDLGYNRGGDPRRPVFIGEVGFVGKVIPGSQGWRAEKGRIVRLYVPFQHFRYVEWLERLYQVPVLLDNTLNVTPTFGEGGTHGDR
jgi:hypothetical protein